MKKDPDVVGIHVRLTGGGLIAHGAPMSESERARKLLEVHAPKGRKGQPDDCVAPMLRRLIERKK